MKSNFKMSEKFLYRPQCIRQNKEHCNVPNIILFLETNLVRKPNKTRQCRTRQSIKYSGDFLFKLVINSEIYLHRI